MNIIYDIISKTGEWLVIPAALIGPYGSVYITVGHKFFLYFILNAIGLLWLSYKIRNAPISDEEIKYWEDKIDTHIESQVDMRM